MEAADLTPWLVSSYLITSIALQSPGGKLGDLIGHGRALVVGLSLVAAGGVLGLLVGEVHALGAARILMASGGAATVPATMAILRNQTAADRRARVFGLFGACMGLAAAIGPLVGGELTERFGWRAVFAANLPVIAVSLLLVLTSRGMYTRAVANRPPFDWLGSALLAAGLTLTIVALQMSGAAAWWLGGGGAVLLAVFPFWERRTASPVVDFSLLTRRGVLRRRLDHRVAEHGDVPAALPVAGLLRSGPPSRRAHDGSGAAGADGGDDAQLDGGRAADRARRRAGADACRFAPRAGGAVVVRGLCRRCSAPLDVMPGMLLIGAGVGMTSPPAQAASMSTVGREQAGMAGGVLSTMRYLGGVAGTTALGALLRDSASPASHQRPIVVYAAALGTAAVLSLLTLPGRPRRG